MTTITLQPDHALLMPVVVGIFLTNFVLGGMVGAARNKYKIKVPNLYATPAMYWNAKEKTIDMDKFESEGQAFNQVQRGHQHMFEGVADAYALLFACGLFYPRYAAQWGVMYIAGTLLYAMGYTVQPKYRVLGELLYFPAIIGWIYGCYTAGTAVYYGGKI